MSGLFGGSSPKAPPVPSPSPTPKEQDISAVKATERRRLGRGTNTLLTQNWLQEPNISQMRLGGM